MTIGVRVRDRVSGQVLMDSSSAMMRLIGSYTIAGTGSSRATGSISVPAFVSGTPWIALVQGGQATTVFLHQATANVSGTNINWGSGQFDAHLLYGVYAAGSASGKIGSGDIGIRIVNGNQATLIDSEYQAFAFASKQAISLPSQGQTTISYTGGYPIIAFRGTGTICIAAMRLSGSTWSIDIFGGYGTGASGTIYIFDSVLNGAQITPGNIGVRFRNRTTGQVTYDSRYRYAKIYRVAASPSYRNVPAIVHTEQLGQDSLAFCGNMPGTWWAQYYISPGGGQFSSSQGGNTQEWTAYMTGGGVNGTTLTTQSMSIFASSSDSIVSDDSDTQYTLIDVSGL